MTELLSTFEQKKAKGELQKELNMFNQNMVTMKNLARQLDITR